MAKLKGPLFSLNAHATIGNELTYSGRSSGSQVRFQKKQMDYTNPDREAQRTRFWAAVQWWKDLTTTEKTQWVILGRNR